MTDADERRGGAGEPQGSVSILHAQESAGEGLEALVLLHGFGGSHRTWDEVLRFLKPACRILAYDLPGHAGSLNALGEGAAPAFAKMILADLEARGIGSVHLAGHSLGGAVAVLMGLFEPGRIRSMTLLAPGGFGPEISGELLRDLARSVTAEEIASSLRAMAAPWFEPPAALVTTTVDERAVPGQREALEILRSRIVHDGRQGAFTPGQLASLTMPVHLVWGERDPVLPVSQAQNAPSRFACTLVPHLGHMLPIEAPESMAELIARSMA